MGLLHTGKDGQHTYAIFASRKSVCSFIEMKYTKAEIKQCLPENEYSDFICRLDYEYCGSMPLYTTLFSYSVDKKPLLIYDSEGGECDTCMCIFLKYEEGQRPDFDRLIEMRALTRLQEKWRIRNEKTVKL